MEKKIVIIGVGNCGSQVAALAATKYPELFDTIYINSSDADLSQVSIDNPLKFKIGDPEEVEGSGKNRTKMKEYLLTDIERIMTDEDLSNTVKTKKYAFIVTSAAGGTGSGAGPVLMELMRRIFVDTSFVLVGVLPQINASLMEQGNALEFLTELYDILGESTTYMMYDNESTSNLPPTKALEVVNECIVEDIRILSGVDNYSTPYESIDDADMESIITTPGRLLVTRITKGLTEKRMEDTKLDEIIIKAIKQSCHTETDRNKRVVRYGVITYFTDTVNHLYDGSLDGVADFLGTPIERFNHNAVNPGQEGTNFFYLVAAGLSPVNDRVKKITNRIEELKNALATDDSSKFILSGGSSYADITQRRKEEKRSKIDVTVDAGKIFEQFMGGKK